MKPVCNTFDLWHDNENYNITWLCGLCDLLFIQLSYISLLFAQRNRFHFLLYKYLFLPVHGMTLPVVVFWIINLVTANDRNFVATSEIGSFQPGIMEYCWHCTPMIWNRKILISLLQIIPTVNGMATFADVVLLFFDMDARIWATPVVGIVKVLDILPLWCHNFCIV